jgi:hypothetical protein
MRMRKALLLLDEPEINEFHRVVDNKPDSRTVDPRAFFAWVEGSRLCRFHTILPCSGRPARPSQVFLAYLVWRPWLLGFGVVRSGNAVV